MNTSRISSTLGSLPTLYVQEEAEAQWLAYVDPLTGKAQRGCDRAE